MLHDIGKIGISLETLNKTEPLTDNDWLDIKKHPEVGYRILSTVNDLAEIADFVLAHHENWDGSGYPRRISGNEIPFQSRILALADAYDAMTNPHSYKRAMTEEEAIAEIRANAGKQFDPELSELFIQTIRNSVAL
jgi:HD-GYP domain-containing protein (c-di-GMP phosphodiesterase class II)